MQRCPTSASPLKQSPHCTTQLLSLAPALQDPVQRAFSAWNMLSVWTDDGRQLPGDVKDFEKEVGTHFTWMSGLIEGQGLWPAIMTPKRR